MKKNHTDTEQFLDRNAAVKAEVFDRRLLPFGNNIPVSENGYADQPYIIDTDDGAWLLCVTSGLAYEGTSGQTVVTMRSTDHGKTWQDICEIEPRTGPEASYAVLLKVPSGRVYCFYNHNTDNIRSVETANSGTYYRVDSLGHFVFKFSDDHGRTWSEKRYEIPQRNFEIDEKNFHKGELKYFWNVGKAFSYEGKAYVPLHKIGEFGRPGGFVTSEGALLCSENLLRESDPEKIVWQTLPEGKIGLRAPEGAGRVAEEQSIVSLSDGSFCAVYRTVSGYSATTYSRDQGKSFEKPQFMHYPDGRRIKNPRAANFIWKCKNGKYLYWFHNNSSKGYANRNPVWVLGGVESKTENGNVISWSQPEILLYDDDPILLISYPDMIEGDGGYYISETQKRIARTHYFPKEFFENIWGQFDQSEEISGNYREFTAGKHAFDALPEFYKRNPNMTAGGWVSKRNGLGIVLDFSCLKDGDILFDTSDGEGKGMKLVYTDRNFCLFASDGKTKQYFDTAEDFIEPSGQLAILLDAGANVVSFIFNGKFCDGGTNREFGWSRMSPYLGGVNGNNVIMVSEKVSRLRIYERRVSVSEAVKQYRYDTTSDTKK